MALAALFAVLLVQSQTTDGLSLYKQHRFLDAARAFEQVISRTGEHPDTVLLAGQSYYYAGQYAKAIPWLQKAAAASTHSLEVSFMLGNAYLFTQQPDEAVGSFAEVFGFPPDSAAAHLAAAEMMVRQELLDFAENQLHLALVNDPKIPQAHYLLGIIALSRSGIDTAIQEFHFEIALNPNFAMTYYRLGDAYSRREEWGKAIPELQRSIWLNPGYNGPYILLGKAFLKKGDLTNAEGILRRAVQMDPRNRTANYLLGQTLIQNGRKEEGRQILERSVHLAEDPQL